MVRLPKFSYVIVLLMLVFVLSGCELPRDSAVADVAPVDEMPPTLAPLGIEEGVNETDAAVEAPAAAPTVINVQPIVAEEEIETTSEEAVAEEPQTIENKQEEAVIVSVTPAISNEAAEAAISQETAVNPVAETEPAEEEPIVVDATTATAPPADNPVAANPPMSETYGDYVQAGSHLVQPGDTLFSISRRYGVSVEAIMFVNGLPNDIVRLGQTLIIPEGEDGYTAPPANRYAPPTYDTPPTYDGTYSSPNQDGYGYNPNRGVNPARRGPAEGYHIVRKGETLFSIARRYNTSSDLLITLNGLTQPFVIYPGQTLRLPDPGSYQAPQQQPYQQPGQPQWQQPYPEQQPYQEQPQMEQPYQEQPQWNQPYYDQAPQQGQPHYQQPPNAQPQQPNPNYGPAPGANTHTVVAGETLYSIANQYGTTAESLALANGLTNPNQLYVGQVLYLP